MLERYRNPESGEKLGGRFLMDRLIIWGKINLLTKLKLNKNTLKSQNNKWQNKALVLHSMNT